MYKLYNGDCLELMKDLAPGSVDMVFTSPPYNLGVSSGGGMKSATRSGKWKNAALCAGYSTYDDSMPYEKYVEWQKSVLTVCWSLLSDAGAIYYNHKPRVQNGLLQTPLDLNPGLPVRQIVIWKRKGGINFSPTFYLPTHEWIVIFAKPGFRLKSKGASGVGDVWEIGQERNNTHPAPFPVELAHRAIESTTCQNILDPFMGSGTVGVACEQLNRNFIGIDISSEYVAMSEQRIKAVTPTQVASPIAEPIPSQLRWESHPQTNGYSLCISDTETAFIGRKSEDERWEVTACIAGQNYRGERAELSEAFIVADNLVITKAPHYAQAAQ